MDADRLRRHSNVHTDTEKDTLKDFFCAFF